MTGLQKTNYPEEKIDVDEEEGVGQKKRMVQAPSPQAGTGIAPILVIVIQKRKIEENGGKRSQQSYHRILQISHSLF